MWRAVFVSQMKCDVCGYEDFRNLITCVEKNVTSCKYTKKTENIFRRVTW